MGALRAGYDWCLYGLAALAAAAVLAMFVLVVVDVTIRATGFDPPAGIQAVVEYLVLYFTMFAAPYVLRRRAHVFIELLVGLLGPRARAVFGRIVAAVCGAVSLLMAYYGWRLVADAWISGDLDIRSIDIPMWLLYVPLPIGFVFIAVEFLIFAADPDGLYGAPQRIEH
jgi:TRAP-type C4-dicarboxylate transport system permease small subunit